MTLRILIVALGVMIAFPASSQRSMMADPSPDRVHPAGMAVLHIPTGGVEVNGVAYTPAGVGPHPVMVILHGLPGNEKNLDLAQAARRDGWVAVTFNYRGSWGSPGRFGFAHVLEDVDAVLAYLRRPDVAARLGADPGRIVLAGHSMGGWAVFHTAAHDHALLGAVAISPADLGVMGRLPRAQAVAVMTDNDETLVTTPAAMADEVIARRTDFAIARATPGLTATRLLVLTSDDGLAPPADALVAALRRAGNIHVDARHVATDHGWSDHRIALQEAILSWADLLRGR